MGGGEGERGIRRLAHLVRREFPVDTNLAEVAGARAVQARPALVVCSLTVARLVLGEIECKACALVTNRENRVGGWVNRRIAWIFWDDLDLRLKLG